MTAPLSAATTRRLHFLFRGPEPAEAKRLVFEECGDNLPFVEATDEPGIELLRYAAIKLSDGRIDSLRKAVALAKIDWRDLLMEAGFGDDKTAHQRWLQ